MQPNPYLERSDQNLGGEYITAIDAAGRAANVVAYTVTNDTTIPGTGGTTISYWSPVWQPGPSVDVTMTGTMTDTQSGVGSYQLQREQTPLTGATCDPLTGIYANVGAPVLGNPPPALGAVPDATVVDGMCYRYRVEVTDNVGNVSYSRRRTRFGSTTSSRP